MSRVKRVRKAAKVARQLRRDLEQCELLVGNMGRSYVFDTGPCEADVPGIIKGIMSMAKCVEPGLNGGEKEVALKIQPIWTAPKDRLILLSIPPYKLFEAHWRIGRWVSSEGRFMSATPDMEGGENVIYGDVSEPAGWSELPGEPSILEESAISDEWGFSYSKREGAHEEATRFELGKCYKHSAGDVMKIVGSANTFFHGICLVGEDQYGELQTVGNSIESITGWVEIDGCDFHPENVGSERSGRT